MKNVLVFLCVAFGFSLMAQSGGPVGDKDPKKNKVIAIFSKSRSGKIMSQESEMAKFEIGEKTLAFVVHEYYHEPYIIQNATHIQFDFEVFDASHNVIYAVQNVQYTSRTDERLTEYTCSSCEFLQVPHFVDYQFSVDLTPLLGENGCSILQDAYGSAKVAFYDFDGPIYPSQESVCGSLWPNPCMMEVNDEAILLGTFDCSVPEGDFLSKSNNHYVNDLEILDNKEVLNFAIYSIDGRLLSYLTCASKKELHYFISSRYLDIPTRIVQMK